MKKLATILAAGVMLTASLAGVAFAEGKKIGFVWLDLSDEHSKSDEINFIAAIEANGDTYISADATVLSAENSVDIKDAPQIGVEKLLSQGSDVIIFQTSDMDSFSDAFEKYYSSDGVPFVSYGAISQNKSILSIVAKGTKQNGSEESVILVGNDQLPSSAALAASELAQGKSFEDVRSALH